MSAPTDSTSERLALRRLACDIPCDERSLRKELSSPGSVKGMAGERIRKVLREKGIVQHRPAAISTAALGLGARRP